MTRRRPIRINVQLPELTPVQAESLWNFLEDLTSELWDAYEPELLDLDAERLSARFDDDPAPDDQPCASRNDLKDDESDPEF